MSLWLNIKSNLPKQDQPCPVGRSEKLSFAVPQLRSSDGQYFDILTFISQAETEEKNPAGRKFWIGREIPMTSGLLIADDRISRHHCYIEKTAGGTLRIVDNNSVNGVFVNGIKVTETLLTEGDIIRVGPYEMILTAMGPALPTQQAAPEPACPESIRERGGSRTGAGGSGRQSKDDTDVLPERAGINIGEGRKIGNGKWEIAPRRDKIPQPLPIPLADRPEPKISHFKLTAAVVLLIISGILLATYFLFQNDIRTGRGKESLPLPPSQVPLCAQSGIPKLNPPRSVAQSGAITPVSIPLSPRGIAKENAPASQTVTANEEPQMEESAFDKWRQAQKEQSDAKLKAEQDQKNAAKQQQTAEQISVAETRSWNEQKTQLAPAISKYQYSTFLKSMDDQLKATKTEAIRQEIAAYIEELQGERTLFDNMLADLTSGAPRKKIVIDTHDIWVTSADETGFQGTLAGVSGSVYNRRWSDVPMQSILNLFPKDLDKSGRFYLAVFCYHHNFTEEGEQRLIQCLTTFPAEKERISQFLARVKNIPIPAGGWAVYQGQLVTAEDKSYLEQGYVKYQAKWMTYDEMMTQKGFVKFQNRWVTPAEKEKIEAQLSALAALKKQLAPKGVIDRPGADKEKLGWDKARIKETEHYTVRSNLSQEAVDDVCYMMECFYFEAKKIFKLARDPGSKLTVFVFNDSKDYFASGGPPGSGGVFMTSGKGRQIMTFYQPPMTTSVLLHEGTHQFIHTVCNTNVPIWIDEGMATYYESSKFEGTTLKTNLVNQNRLQLIKNLIAKKDVPRLEDIINIRQANFTINEYAQCWSLVYFFMNYNHGQYAEELENYFEAIKAKGFENRPQHKKLFEDAFKVKFEVLEQQWEDYIKKLG